MLAEQLAEIGTFAVCFRHVWYVDEELEQNPMGSVCQRLPQGLYGSANFTALRAESVIFSSIAKYPPCKGYFVNLKMTTKRTNPSRRSDPEQKGQQLIKLQDCTKLVIILIVSCERVLLVLRHDCYQDDKST